MVVSMGHTRWARPTTTTTPTTCAHARAHTYTHARTHTPPPRATQVGNVYVKFREEESAAKAVAALQGRYYNGRPILIEFSPVTDFREATCRQYEENTCNRGGYCNFMHLKPIGKDLRRQLFGRYKRRSPSREG